MRNSYKKIQKGMETKYNLSQDRIERLEEIASNGSVSTAMRHSRSIVASSKYSKRSLDIAMFLECVRIIHHWDTGVTI